MKIITGRAATRPEIKILDSIRESVKDDPLAGIIVVVPPQATYLTQKRIIDYTGQEGIMGVDVISPENLVARICNKIYGKTLPVLNDAGRCMLFCLLLSQYQAEIPYLGGNTARPEIAKGLSELLSEIKGMNIDAEQLASYKTDDADFEEKLREISFIFGKFEQWSSFAGITRQDQMKIATEHIGECDFIRRSHVYVMGFDALSEQMLNMLGQLDNTARSLTVCMISSEKGCGDDDVFLLADAYLKKLSCLYGVKPERIKQNSPDIAPEISHVEKYLFAYPAGITDTSDRVGVFSCDDMEQEIMACCEKSAELIAAGYRPGDIAIVASQISGYRNYIKKYFGEANIPYFLSEQRTLLDNPVSVFILSALRLCFGRLDKYRILEHVSCGLLGSAEDRRRIDRLIRNKTGNVYRLTKPADDIEDELSRQKCIVPLLNFISSFRKSKTTEDKIVCVEKYLGMVRVDDFIASMQHQISDNQFVDAVDYFAQLQEKYVELFAQVRLFSQNTDARLLYDMFLSAMTSTNVGIIPALSDAVLFGDISVLCMPEVRAVMIIGVNDGVLPDFTETNKILSFRQKTSLVSEFTGIDSEGIICPEKYAVYKAASKPSECLYMYYHTSEKADSGIAGANPSMLITKFQELFRGMNVISAKEKIGHNLLSNAILLSMAEKGLQVRGESAEYADLLSAVLKNEYALNKLKKSEKLINDNKTQTLLLEQVTELYGNIGSISAYQTYYECPFRYFMRYGLKPEIENDPEMSGQDFGTYIHALIHEYDVSLKKDGLSIKKISDDELRDRFDNASDSLRKSDEYRNPDNERKHVLDQLEKEVLSVIMSLKNCKGQSLSDVESTEYEFDETIGGTEIKGAVDRVDSAVINGEKYYSVVDYKTGAADYSFTPGDFVKGLTLQLPVYLLALSNRMGGAHPLGAGYMKIDSGDKKFKETGFHVDDKDLLENYFGTDDGRIQELGIRLTKNGMHGSDVKNLYTAKEIGDIMKYAEKLVSDAHDRIGSGKINDIPVPDSNGKYKCSICDYRNICTGRKEDDPLMKDTAGKEEYMEIITREVNDGI